MLVEEELAWGKRTGFLQHGGDVRKRGWKKKPMRIQWQRFVEKWTVGGGGSGTLELFWDVCCLITYILFCLQCHWYTALTKVYGSHFLFYPQIWLDLNVSIIWVFNPISIKGELQPKPFNFSQIPVCWSFRIKIFSHLFHMFSHIFTKYFHIFFF